MKSRLDAELSRDSGFEAARHLGLKQMQRNALGIVVYSRSFANRAVDSVGINFGQLEANNVQIS